MDKIFPYDAEVERLYSQAQKLFRASMNGIVSQSMSALGYKLNFGVALPRIKEISLRFEPNMLLAQRAWWSGCREMMIFATHLLGRSDAEKNPMKPQDLEEWSSQIINLELCEQFSKNYLSRIDFKASEMFSHYLLENRKDKFQIALAYINYCNLLLREPTAEIDKSFLFAILERDAYSDEYFIYSSAARCLRILTRTSEVQVKNFVERLDPGKGPGVNLIKEEVNTALF